MSLEISAKIICDGCGSEVHGKKEHRGTHAIGPYFWAKRFAKELGWVTQSGGKYRVQKHFCAGCADGKKPKVPEIIIPSK